MNNSITHAASSAAPHATSSLKLLIRDARGLSTVEYVILLALIAVAGISLWGTFGEKLGDKIGEGTDAIEQMGGTSTPMPGL